MCFLREKSIDDIALVFDATSAATVDDDPDSAADEDPWWCSSMSSDRPVPDRSRRNDRCIVTNAENLADRVDFIRATRSTTTSES